MLKIPFGKPIIGHEEKEAVNKVLSGSKLVHGPVSDEFENLFSSFTGAKNAVSVSSCTAGMHLIYFVLGFGPGDEVIIPAQTHMATAHAIELVGARPVFIDVDKNGNIDINRIEKKINSRTKAITVVHYLGAPVDMPKVKEIAERNNLFLFEDCALSLGSKINNTHVGLFGDAGIFSFYPVKHLTTAEGGMVILNDNELAKKLKLAKAFGVNRNYSERKIPGMYDAEILGLNYRMSEISAAIGIEQLKKIPNFLKQRKKNFNQLIQSIKNIPYINIIPQPDNDYYKSSYYCLGIILDKKIAIKRALIMHELEKKGVGSSIYYPHPVPRISYYRKKYGYDENLFIKASMISDQIIALPVGPHLSSSDMDYIYNSIKEIWSKTDV